MRQIVLDTETTGLRVEEGHRIIEIGCMELVNRKLTGNHFHHYINPEREVEAGAVAVHGIKNEFLKDKPTFNIIVQEFMAFIGDSELIIHNAPFDLGFLNSELTSIKQGWKPLTKDRRIIDTLEMARKLHVGQRNSLDALCKRYGIDNSKRDLHGALLDAHLLAQVYLVMTGGQGSFFDSLSDSTVISSAETSKQNELTRETQEIRVINASEQEIAEHEKYLKKMQQQGQCLWLEN